MELELRSVERQVAHEAGGRAQGAGAPPTPWLGCGAPGLDLLPGFFIISKNSLRKVFGHSENFYFCTKITPWQFYRKHR